MKGKTILLIEDNPKVMRNNSSLLNGRGAMVLTAETLIEARRILDAARKGAQNLDTAVIDITLPDGSGLDLLKEIRSSEISDVSSIPVLLLTAKGESQDVVQGLCAGADDYLAKPYDMDVFAARIEALLRRAGMKNILKTSNNVTLGRLRFDMINNQTFYDGKDLLLSPIEFALLFLLAQNERKVLSVQYLFEKVWQQPFRDKTALKVHIHNLKKKLSLLDADILIETSRGEGYSLVKING